MQLSKVASQNKCLIFIILPDIKCRFIYRGSIIDCQPWDKQLRLLIRIIYPYNSYETITEIAWQPRVYKVNTLNTEM